MLDELKEVFHRAVDAHDRRVDAQMVGGSGSPSLVAVVVVVAVVVAEAVVVLINFVLRGCTNGQIYYSMAYYSCL